MIAGDNFIIVKMKMKIRCNLCEKSLHRSKIDGTGCTHSPFSFIFDGNVPPEMVPFGFGLQSGLPNNPFLQLPQINVKLAAYLLRGEKLIREYILNL